jgi:hypothetical protein
LKIIQPISLTRVDWSLGGTVFDPHVVVADNIIDRENIVITIYEPDSTEWEAGFKKMGPL